MREREHYGSCNVKKKKKKKRKKKKKKKKKKRSHECLYVCARKREKSKINKIGVMLSLWFKLEHGYIKV